MGKDTESLRGSEVRDNENNPWRKEVKDCENGDKKLLKLGVRELNFLREAKIKEGKTLDREEWGAEKSKGELTSQSKETEEDGGQE